MASINGGNGKYLHHFTGGHILQDGERYNQEFFKNNFNRSNSVKQFPKFNHSNAINSSNNASNIEQSRSILLRNSSQQMLGLAGSNLLHGSNSTRQYPGSNAIYGDNSTLSQSVASMLQNSKGNLFHNQFISAHHNRGQGLNDNSLYLLSPLEQKVVPVENIFKKQKQFLRRDNHVNVYSSHRNYLESLAKEKTLNFSKEDLERIQIKARNLHWLSSHEENPAALRPREFYTKEIPKRQNSQESYKEEENYIYEQQTSLAQRGSRIQGSKNRMRDSSSNLMSQNNYQMYPEKQQISLNNRLYDSAIMNEMRANQSFLSSKSNLREFKYNFSIVEKNIYYQQQQTPSAISVSNQIANGQLLNTTNNTESRQGLPSVSAGNDGGGLSKQSILQFMQQQQKEIPKNEMKDYLIKVKCIDDHQSKIIKKKQSRRNSAARQPNQQNSLLIQSDRDRSFISEMPHGDISIRQDDMDENAYYSNKTSEKKKTSLKPRIERVVSMPTLKLNREGQILQKVKANIARIERQNQGDAEDDYGSMNEERHYAHGSLLQDTIQETQGLLKDAINESKQKQEKDLERRYFLMNVIQNNVIHDQKKLELEQEQEKLRIQQSQQYNLMSPSNRQQQLITSQQKFQINQQKQQSKAKSFQTEMKRVYDGYRKDALDEVKKIKNDMLLQAFKKKIEKDIVANGGQSALDNSKSKIKDAELGNSRLSSKNVSDNLDHLLNSSNIAHGGKVSINSGTYFMFEDTPSRINLVKRANQRQEQFENMPRTQVQKDSILNPPQKRQIHLLSEEKQTDVQLEQVGEYHKLQNHQLRNQYSGHSGQGGLQSYAVTIKEEEKYALSVSIPPSLEQTQSNLGHQSTILRDHSTSNIILSRQPKTQQQKIQEFLAETQQKIEHLKKENKEMQRMSDVQINGEHQYKEQESENQKLTKRVFELVKNNEAQDLHRFLKAHGGSYASVIDKLGETPLHWAIKRGYSECTEILLNFGGDPHQEDFFKRKPSDFIDKVKVLEIEKCMKQFDEGKYEPSHAKFEARELILKEPQKKKKQDTGNPTLNLSKQPIHINF